MCEEILYTGNLFQVVRRKKQYFIPLNNETKQIDLEYELVKRPPGVRAIVIREGKVLLNKEFRYELNDWDYRLPGGKIFDSQKQAGISVSQYGFTHCIEEALKRELMEESGLEIKNAFFYECSHCGFSVEWDLYYYIVTDFVECKKSENIEKSEFEYIQTCWVDYQTAVQYCMEKKMSEERSVAVLLRFLLLKADK